MNQPILTMLTDFGLEDTYVAQMKGVILSMAPSVRIVDVTHQIPPQDVAAASRAILSILPVFPEGTIHLCVVDPGVGSQRSFLLVRADNQWIFAPDNGMITPLLRSRRDLEIRELSETWYRRNPCSHTFHGRDIVAPAAACLANGTSPDRLGPLLNRPPKLLDHSAPQSIPNGLLGIVVDIDRFGNLLTDITPDLWSGRSPEEITVRIAGKSLTPLRQYYSQVSGGELLALVNSFGTLEVACRNGNAANLLGAVRGTSVELAWNHGNSERPS